MPKLVFHVFDKIFFYFGVPEGPQDFAKIRILYFGGFLFVKSPPRKEEVPPEVGICPWENINHCELFPYGNVAR